MVRTAWSSFLVRFAGGGLGNGSGEDRELLERFVQGRDETAFAALLRRHGPMVLGVCRRVLANEHDAEDAFQATFLVLARKAASIGLRDRIGNWLHGVAYRTAIKARSVNRLRRAREQEAATRQLDHRPDEGLQQLLAVLDEEINRLPKRYQAPIVLCELQGRSIQEAAAALGCPAGTLASRLARGRKLLARRLAHRMGGGTPAATITQFLSLAVLSPTPSAATVQGALSCVGQAGAGAMVSANVLSLAQGTWRSMMLTKLKITAALLTLTASLCLALGTVIGSFAQAPAGKGSAPPATLSERPLAGAAAADPEEAVEKELKLLDGTWTVVALEADGKKAPADALKGMRWVFKGKELNAHDPDGKESRATIKLAPDSSPKKIDMLALDGEFKGKVVEGIYELKDVRLKVCLRDPKEKDRGRPKDFDTTGEKGLGTITLEKEAERGGPAPSAKLDGRWLVVRAMKDGKEIEGYVGNVTVVFDGAKMTIVHEKEGGKENTSFALNLATNPATFDITPLGDDDQKLDTHRGIARMEKDRIGKDKITICHARALEARPKELMSTKDNHCVLLVLERK
jgi:RNA polymerase sigma-70 factor (ECF subfamily)